MSLPPAIFFINADINSTEQSTLKTQLFIDEFMSKTEFDLRIETDPNYATVVHLQGLRVVVILPSFHDLTNRTYADVVMFLHQGLADIEFNRFGPPCQNFPVQRLTMYELLRAVGSPSVVILPFQALPACGSCKYPFFCDTCHTFSGIKTCGTCGGGCACGCTCGLTDNQGIRINPIHAPNCDNEYHNIDFINRK